MIGLYFYKKTKMNIDWNLLIASFSAMAASAASIATFLGWKENRELRKAQTDPFVDIKLESVEDHLCFIRLKITNIGKGGAFDLKIKLQPCLELSKEQQDKAHLVIKVFKSRSFMTKGINYLAPLDHKYTSFLNLYGYAKEVVTSEEFFNLKWIAVIEYKDFKGTPFKREFVIDASEFDEYRLGKTFHEAVPKSLEALQKSLENINKNIAKQTTLLDKKSKSDESHWNEYELKQKLKEIEFIKKRNTTLGIDNKKINFKKLDKKQSIHELRKQNK